jgi:hypothetical protein
MNDLNQTARPAPGTSFAADLTRLPVTVALSQLRRFELTAPDGTPATVRFRRPQQLQPGDVTRGQRDRWAVVTHVTLAGLEVAIRVQEAGGSRTITRGARAPAFDVRADLRIDPSTCPDIPDGFPPRWGVWRPGSGLSPETTWFPEPGKAARHARQASRDGSEYVVELEAPDGSWTQVDAYRQGRRSAWGTRLAAGQGRTVVPPWAAPVPGPAPELSGRLAALGFGDGPLMEPGAWTGASRHGPSLSLDFPKPVTPGTPQRPGAPHRATGQASPPPARRTP